MAASDNKSSNENDEVVAAYQSMARSPSSSLSALDISDTTPASDATSVNIPHEEGEGIAPPGNAVTRVLREYRVLEFGCTALIYLLALLFAKIEVNERPIPGIKVRLSSTAFAWSLIRR